MPYVNSVIVLILLLKSLSLGLLKMMYSGFHLCHYLSVQYIMVVCRLVVGRAEFLFIIVVFVSFYHESDYQYR